MSTETKANTKIPPLFPPPKSRGRYGGMGGCAPTESGMEMRFLVLRMLIPPAEDDIFQKMSYKHLLRAH